MLPLERLVNLSVVRQCINSRHMGLFSLGKKKEKETEKEGKNDLYSIEGDLIDKEAIMKKIEEELEMKRNKSGLRPQHRNTVLGLPPYDTEFIPFHKTMTYKRKMFATYGYKSRVDPGALWYLRSDMTEMDKFEQIAHPHSIQESVEIALEKKRKEEEAIWERESKILENLSKLEDWKKQVHQRAAKKKADMEAAKAKKDALIEEVRRHFGYTVDPRDEKFKEMLLQKEKDYKKKMKEQKAKAKQEKLLQQIQKGTTE